MTNISDILNKATQIKELVKQFGYKSNIKIYHEAPPTAKFPLKLIVQEDKPQDSIDLDDFLEAQLIRLLNCQVNIIDYAKIEKLYQYDIDKKSLSIDDHEAMQILLQKDIVYNALTEEDQLFQDVILKQSDDYLKKHSMKTEAKEENYQQQQPTHTPTSIPYTALSKRKTTQEQSIPPEKKPKLTVNKSNTTVSLIIPIPENLTISSDKSLQQGLANELANHFFERINKLSPGSQNNLEK